MSAIYILWLRELKRYSRSRAQIVASLGQPLLYLLVLGFGLGPVFERAGQGSYIQFVAPGVIGMSVLFSSIFSGIGLLWDTHHTVSAGKEKPADTWAALGQWVHHTHIKDSTPGEKGVSYVLTGDGTIGVRDVVKALAAGGYKGYYGFEWEKHWHPEIAEPDVAFPQYAKVMSEWLAESGVTPR